MSRRSDALALTRAVQREEALDARGPGSALVLEAAKAAQSAPASMRYVTLAELAALRASAVGQRWHIEAAMVSLDGRRTVMRLGEERTR